MQCAVFAHIRARIAPGVLCWHTPNGGYRHPAEAAKLERMGVLPGVSDILAFNDNGQIFAMELKAKGGRLTPAQGAFLSFVDGLEHGYTAVCDDLDAAVRCLESWGILRGKAA